MTALVDPDSDTDPAPRHFLGIYYDTAEGELAAQRCSLRARKEDGVLMAALKLAGGIENGLSCRMEYEASLDKLLETAADLPEGELKDEVAKLISLDAPLDQQVEVDMQRSIRDLLVPGEDGVVSKVELVADEGVIRAAGLSESLYEIELELKEGDIAPILELGERLKTQFELTPSERTKHQIGLALRASADAPR